MSAELQAAHALLDRIRSEEALSEEQFVERCLKDMMGGWVPLARYLQMFPDETANAVYKRVQNGVWAKQVHYAKPTGSAAWVNLPAIRLWVEGKLGQSAK